jgi:hypothetical protein
VSVVAVAEGSVEKDLDTGAMTIRGWCCDATTE